MKCVQCDKEFEAERSTRKFCSGACTKKYQRGVPKESAPLAVSADPPMIKAGYIVPDGMDMTPGAITYVEETPVHIAPLPAEVAEKPEKKLSPKKTKLVPVLNGMTGEPGMHSGWYWYPEEWAWRAKFGKEMLTHEEARAKGLDTEKCHKEPLMREVAA